MRKIRVWFLDWYDPILKGSSEDNLILDLLKKNFEVELDSKNPEILFYALNYNAHLNYKNCLKIFVTGEPGFWSPELINRESRRGQISVGDADYIMLSSKVDHPNYFHFPNGLLFAYQNIKLNELIDDWDFFTKPRINRGRKFCCYIHTNLEPVKRKELYEKLNKYKKVDTKEDLGITPYAGSNLDGSYVKTNAASNYKFCFAMANHFYKDENGIPSLPGFIDEKMFEAYIAGCIPLYYGNDKIDEMFNPKSFINWHDYGNDEDFINRVIEVDTNQNLFLEYMSEPPILNIEKFKLKETEEFLKNIINNYD